MTTYISVKKNDINYNRNYMNYRNNIISVLKEMTALMAINDMNNNRVNRN